VNRGLHFAVSSLSEIVSDNRLTFMTMVMLNYRISLTLSKWMYVQTPGCSQINFFRIPNLYRALRTYTFLLAEIYRLHVAYRPMQD